MSKDILYLGSQSKPRQRLLDLSDISYKVLEHRSDECGVEFGKAFDEYVLSIAREKMEHLVYPDAYEGEQFFVLTADTLARTAKGKQILTKPGSIQKAKEMLAMLRAEPAEVVTGCCLEKKEFKDGNWHVLDQNHWTTRSVIEFCIPEDSADWYYKKMPQAINACGGAMIESFGQNFLKSVQGSYTTILGLPLYELRQNLKNLGFKFD